MIQLLPGTPPSRDTGLYILELDREGLNWARQLISGSGICTSQCLNQRFVLVVSIHGHKGVSHAGTSAGGRICRGNGTVGQRRNDKNGD